MEAAMEALVGITQLLGSALGALTLPTDLSATEQIAAAAALLANVGGIAAARAISRRTTDPVEQKIAYDEAA